jgi:hypothetical protein
MIKIKIPKIKSGIAVDIDETLSWTVGHWFKEMTHLFGNPEKLSIKKLATKYRYTQNVPYWQTKEVLSWIESQKHSNELQKILPLIKNANHYLNKIDKIKPVAVYLTTRPENVIKGTKFWLDKHGFPKAPIICRPLNWKDNSNLWKAGVLLKLYPQILGIIDDNPELLTFLEAKNYQGTVYLYDNKNIKSKNINVTCAKTWQTLYGKVKRSTEI